MSVEPRKIFEYTLRLADDALILGHRLSEWCSHAPVLEEDLAVANIALDCLGHAQILLGIAAETEGAGRTADDLAYFREAVEFRNVLLVELPSGNDFAFMLARQMLFDAYRIELYDGLTRSTDSRLSAFAEKALKETRYHFRHSASLTVRLGDGTDESSSRMQSAFDACWPYVGELFRSDALEDELSAAGVCPNRTTLRDRWIASVHKTLGDAGLSVPQSPPRLAGPGSSGRHTEHLGHLLSEMQIVARTHPGAKW